MPWTQLLSMLPLVLLKEAIFPGWQRSQAGCGTLSSDQSLCIRSELHSEIGISAHSNASCHGYPPLLPPLLPLHSSPTNLTIKGGLLEMQQLNFRGSMNSCSHCTWLTPPSALQLSLYKARTVVVGAPRLLQQNVPPLSLLPLAQILHFQLFTPNFSRSCALGSALLSSIHCHRHKRFLDITVNTSQIRTVVTYGYLPRIAPRSFTSAVAVYHICNVSSVSNTASCTPFHTAHDHAPVFPPTTVSSAVPFPLPTTVSRAVPSQEMVMLPPKCPRIQASVTASSAEEAISWSVVAPHLYLAQVQPRNRLQLDRSVLPTQRSQGALHTRQSTTAIAPRQISKLSLMVIPPHRSAPAAHASAPPWAPQHHAMCIEERGASDLPSSVLPAHRVAWHVDHASWNMPANDGMPGDRLGSPSQATAHIGSFETASVSSILQQVEESSQKTSPCCSCLVQHQWIMLLPSWNLAHAWLSPLHSCGLETLYYCPQRSLTFSFHAFRGTIAAAELAQVIPELVWQACQVCHQPNVSIAVDTSISDTQHLGTLGMAFTYLVTAALFLSRDLDRLVDITSPWPSRLILLITYDIFVWTLGVALISSWFTHCCARERARHGHLTNHRSRDRYLDGYSPGGPCTSTHPQTEPSPDPEQPHEKQAFLACATCCCMVLLLVWAHSAGRSLVLAVVVAFGAVLFVLRRGWPQLGPEGRLGSVGISTLHDVIFPSDHCLSLRDPQHVGHLETKPSGRHGLCTTSSQGTESAHQTRWEWEAEVSAPIILQDIAVGSRRADSHLSDDNAAFLAQLVAGYD